MKRNARIMISFIIAGAFFALSACRKEWPEETFYELTEDDIQWVPYYDEGFQNKFFRDQSGQVHELNLYWVRMPLTVSVTLRIPSAKWIFSIRVA